MNPELKMLWEDAIGAIDALKADRHTRGIQPLPAFFPIHSSFAHDDPEAHAFALSCHLVDAEWFDDIEGDYAFVNPNLPHQNIDAFIAPSAFQTRLIFEHESFAASVLAAPKGATLLCAA